MLEGYGTFDDIACLVFVCTICLYIEGFMISMFCAYFTYSLYTFDSGVINLEKLRKPLVSSA